MSSSYPESIRTLVTTRKKGGRPRRTPTGAQGDADVQETDVGPSNADQGVGGVQLEYGQDGSARVEKRGNGWVWDFVSGTKDDLKLHVGEGTLLFPASRQLPLLSKSDQKANIAQSLEFVRTICDKYAHLGLDELVNAELSAEVGKEEYDAFLGRRMVYLRNGQAKMARNIVLFAAGELGNHLHAAVLIGDLKRQITNVKLTRILANSTTLSRYPTQILQIAYSPLISPYREDQQATTLIIRQHSSTIIYRITPDNTYRTNHSTPPLNLIKMGEVRIKELGWRRVVDVAIDPVEWGRAALVDESGGVWLWGWKRISGNMKGESEMALTKIRDSDSTEKNRFFRISFGTKPGTLLVISDSEATIIDIEDPTYHSSKILSLDPSRKFTAVDTTASSRQATYTCLVTTREVLWVDETASASPPALSWKHEFSEGEARDLEITHVPQDGNDCFILSSRSNPSLTVFHVSTHVTLQSLHPPYSLSISLDSRLKPLTDLLVLDRNIEILSEEREVDLALLSIASDGSLWGTSLWNQPVDEDDGVLRVGWDSVLESRAEHGTTLYKKPLAPGMEDKEETRYTIMDTRWAWLAINKAVEIGEDDPVFNAEEFSRYIREIDAPFEHYTTAAEIARDSILREGEIKRSHILRQLPIPNLDETEITQLSNLNLERDLHLIHKTPIPPQSIDGHLTESITPLDNLIAIHQALSTAFPLRADTPFSKLRHKRCIDALAVDLTMANIVLSSEAVAALSSANPMREGMTDDDVLARAAGLTLTDNGPPPVEFAILHPKHSAQEDDDDMIVPEHPRSADIQDMTVRSLLAEWNPGAEVGEYTWKPWIETEDRSRNGSTLAIPRPIRPLPSSRPTSPRPPDLENYFSQPIVTNRHAPPVVQSQPLPHSRSSEWSQPNGLKKKGSMPSMALSGFGMRGSSPIPGETQDSMASQGGVYTQIERGPFGGGQGGEKKKKVKKRAVGGF